MKIEDVELLGSVKIRENDALIVVDMQNDFIPGGALPVLYGDTIIPGINQLTQKFYLAKRPIVFTQDWHPPDHHSFASVHDGMKPYDSIEGTGIGPILWPDHCVQNTNGAKFVPGLDPTVASLILQKGIHKEIDSYSAFLENDKKTVTGLKSYLDAIEVNRIFLCGLALDYCVYYSAIDAKKGGFEVICVLDLMKPVDSPEDSTSKALKHMTDIGIQFVTSDQILWE